MAVSRPGIIDAMTPTFRARPEQESGVIGLARTVARSLRATTCWSSMLTRRPDQLIGWLLPK